MDVNELKSSDRIIFECVAGSHAYNLATPSSDQDLRGIFVNPPEEYLGLREPSQQIHNRIPRSAKMDLRRLIPNKTMSLQERNHLLFILRSFENQSCVVC